MFDGDKNEELKNELNGTIGSGETAGEEAAAGNITAARRTRLRAVRLLAKPPANRIKRRGK